MKKFITTIIVSVLAIATVSARNIYSRNVSDLPTPAQTTLDLNFKAKVSVIKIEKGFTGISEYDVVLTDGTEITFDRDGYWTDIEVAYGKKVPDSMVPKTILDYIRANNQNKKIIGIEKNRNTYDIQLENGIEMKFDRAGNFLRYDD